MNNLYWNINTTLDKCLYFVDNDFKPIDEKYLNNYVFDSDKNIKLSLPLNYFSNKESYEIELSTEKKYTMKEFLNLIYDFYNTNLTDKELEYIKNLYDNNLIILNKKYSKIREEYNNLLLHTYENKGKRIDILGSRNVYEGFIQLNNNSYKLLLGY